MPFTDKVVTICLAGVKHFSHFLFFQTVIVYDSYLRFEYYFCLIVSRGNVDMNGQMFIQIEVESDAKDG